jgi:hypothetical protein
MGKMGRSVVIEAEATTLDIWVYQAKADGRTAVFRGLQESLLTKGPESLPAIPPDYRPFFSNQANRLSVPAQKMGMTIQ